MPWSIIWRTIDGYGQRVPVENYQSTTLSSDGFSEETRRFLQNRLRVLSGTVSLIIAILSGAFILNNTMTRGLWTAVSGFLFEFPNSILAVMLLLSASIYLLLRLRRLSSRFLVMLDGLFLQILVFPCLILYQQLHDYSFSGFAYVVPFLMLFILTRAVVVPSPALQTILFSAPAALGVLVIQLLKGASFSTPGVAFPQPYYLDTLIQNQVCLVGAIAVAALASRLNLGLRRTNYDARRVGQYELAEKIGGGSMGEVFRATHSLLKRPTAIKFMRPEIAGREALRRFEAEVRQTSRLTHPNTVSIFDYGQTADGVFYYAMELLDGADLLQIVESTGPMPVSRVIHILSQACGALAEAHEQFIIHRDIKPANLMLCHQGGQEDVLKVLDFGLAKSIQPTVGGALRDREIAGTPATVAPEVIRGESQAASDLYSLATVGYFLLTARPLFASDSTSDLIRSHLEETPRPPSSHRPDIAQDVEGVIMQGLAKDPLQRFASAEAMRQKLMECRDASCWTRAEAVEWWQDFRQRPATKPGAKDDPFSMSAMETLRELP